MKSMQFAQNGKARKERWNEGIVAQFLASIDDLNANDEEDEEDDDEEGTEEDEEEEENGVRKSIDKIIDNANNQPIR